MYNYEYLLQVSLLMVPNFIPPSLENWRSMEWRHLELEQEEHGVLFLG